ncbi:unnamed protein product [Calicophoron daubneyi]|uniref:Secreted protein n=1 Tax=Calicophoron daubneyi TaxID=300641 RepID=A0AAV2T3T5_CALDB
MSFGWLLLLVITTFSCVFSTVEACRREGEECVRRLLFLSDCCLPHLRCEWNSGSRGVFVPNGWMQNKDDGALSYALIYSPNIA